MAINLTTIFGNEIKVEKQPRIADRQHTGFPGAHGLTSMHLGTRGYPLVIRGNLAEYGANYQAAHSNLQSTIDDIEAYLWAGVDDYIFMGETFYNIVFERFQLIPNARGITIHWTSKHYATCEFVCYMRALE